MAKVPLSSSFTFKSNGGLLRVLNTHCHVSATVGPSGVAPTPVEFQAIWDTGATGSAITKQVALACGLVPTGMTQVHGVSGIHVCQTYLVDILLPNKIQVQSVVVTEGILPGGAGGDLLIGMDIIGLGDFVITNKNGRTIFSFRVPSSADTDYVADHHAAVAAASLPRVRNKAAKRPGKSFGKHKR